MHDCRLSWKQWNFVHSLCISLDAFTKEINRIAIIILFLINTLDYNRDLDNDLGTIVFLLL